MFAGLTVTAALVPSELLQLYVPPPLAVSVALNPLHRVVGPLIAAIGIGLTVMVDDAVAEQLLALVTVTV